MWNDGDRFGPKFRAIGFYLVWMWRCSASGISVGRGYLRGGSFPVPRVSWKQSMLSWLDRRGVDAHAKTYLPSLLGKGCPIHVLMLPPPFVLFANAVPVAVCCGLRLAATLHDPEECVAPGHQGGDRARRILRCVSRRHGREAVGGKRGLGLEKRTNPGWRRTRRMLTEGLVGLILERCPRRGLRRPSDEERGKTGTMGREQTGEGHEEGNLPPTNVIKDNYTQRGFTAGDNRFSSQINYPFGPSGWVSSC